MKTIEMDFSKSNAIVDETVEISSQTPCDVSDIRAEKGRKNRLHNCFGLFPVDKSQFAPTRVYQIWPGKNVFFFHGRIMFGPDPRGFLLTKTAILLSDWIFCSYIDDLPPRHCTLIFTLSSVFTLTAIISLALASTRDPGIIPRNGRSPLEEEGVGGRMQGTRSKRINIDGVEMKLKYCKVCQIFRPPRSRHCSICDNCVEKFDHHCPWMGQCVGLRNYRYYVMFLLSAIVFFAYMFAFSWWRIRKKSSERNRGAFISVMDAPETLVLLVFSFFAIWFVGGLAVFHAYLIVRNQTAHENFKRRYAAGSNPYDKGILHNIKEALFTRLPPRTVNFRAVVESKCDSTVRMASVNSADKPDEGESFIPQVDPIQNAELLQMNDVGEHLVEIESNDVK